MDHSITSLIPVGGSQVNYVLGMLSTNKHLSLLLYLFQST